MLGDRDAIATIAVRDLAVARKFYEGTLGLQVMSSESSEALTLRSGNTKVIVYRSEYAGTNKATAINWVLGDDLEKVVRALKEKGVAFEQYEFPGMTRKGDLHLIGPLVAAWFKDPDGNIIALMNR